MTAFSFSDSMSIQVFDAELQVCSEETFQWGDIHTRLSDPNFLPSELQAGMDSAGNKDRWADTMKCLLENRTYFWQYDQESKAAYLRYVGIMWKTLEVAMNCADLQLDFCFFFCRQVMQALEKSKCGGMTFVPVLKDTSNSTLSAASSVAVPTFSAKVRYRAQGLKPDARYRHKATGTQLHGGFLLRPFLTAQGVLPSTSTSSRRK